MFSEKLKLSFENCFRETHKNAKYKRKPNISLK